jgi:hypothetical protein
VCNRSAHCEGINGRQTDNLSTFFLLEAPIRSAHGRAGATGSIRHKRVRCNSDIDQLENHLTAPQNSRPPCTCQIRQNHLMDPRQDDSAPAGTSDSGGTPYRASHDDSRSKIDSAAAADPMAAARATTFIPYRVPTETARMRQDGLSRWRRARKNQARSAC